MKLKKLLKHLDFMVKVIILSVDEYDEEEELFKGSMMDIPWKLVDCKLDTDKNGEAIGFYTDVSGHAPEHYLCIYIKE